MLQLFLHLSLICLPSRSLLAQVALNTSQNFPRMSFSHSGAPGIRHTGEVRNMPDKPKLSCNFPCVRARRDFVLGRVVQPNWTSPAKVFILISKSGDCMNVTETKPGPSTCPRGSFECLILHLTLPIVQGPVINFTNRHLSNPSSWRFRSPSGCVSFLKKVSALLSKQYKRSLTVAQKSRCRILPIQD